ncbi:hypothetical protein PIB30_064511 [Stylosanthes scabra]|uniref:Uncharacterized protein n=1 Tax=Stylosanthes scabra TaxID=79078 RepID=A0ABU6YKN8_9FABA|nr:hypothetical protein [Stylosanthes scabra]
MPRLDQGMPRRGFAQDSVCICANIHAYAWDSSTDLLPNFVPCSASFLSSFFSSATAFFLQTFTHYQTTSPIPRHHPRHTVASHVNLAIAPRTLGQPRRRTRRGLLTTAHVISSPSSLVIGVVELVSPSVLV